MLKFLLKSAIWAVEARYNTPERKGTRGERLVHNALTSVLNEQEYRVMTDLILPVADGTTQIDHIIVSRYGVFVIETKNMKGWIFGSASQKTWTQKIYKHTNKFQNPLHQNYKHVKTLEALLDIPAATIHSLVVFIGDSTFKTTMPDNVTNAGGYIRHIKSKRELVLDQSDVDTVIAQIAQLRLQRGLATNRQHVSHLRQKKESAVTTTPQCPKCGATMVLRTARKGKHTGSAFWGCTTFPAFRGVIKQH